MQAGVKVLKNGGQGFPAEKSRRRDNRVLVSRSFSTDPNMKANLSMASNKAREGTPGKVER